MATSKGRAEMDAFFAAAPGKLASVLRGAARAGANVVADEVKARTKSEDVRDKVRIRTKRNDDQFVSKIDVKPGWARSVATWLEYGTAPHLISVDASQRRGRSVGRINRQASEPGSSHSLVINGKFVGATLMHDGAKPYPFMRVSLDFKETEARVAARDYIAKHVSRAGFITSTEPEDEPA